MPTVRLREVVRATPRTRVLRIALGDASLVFEAGQAVMVGRANSATRSPYSIASAPSLASTGVLELLVPADGAFGEIGLDPADVAGQWLDLEGPLGSFGVPAGARNAPLLLVGGGTGIAPLRSVALDRLEQAHAAPMGLVYSARTPDEFAFGDELAALDQRRLRLHKTVTRDERTADGAARSGRIDDALLAAALPDRDAWCLVCGPSGLVETVTARLESLGVPAGRIIVER